MKIKKELLKDSRTLGNESLKDRLKKITNMVNYLKKILKQKYIVEELEKAGDDVKKLWKILNFLVGKKTAPDIIEPEELDQEKVNKYNNFFATVGLNIQKQLEIDQNYEIDNNFDFESFDFVEETEENIEKIIDNIKSDVATGSDNIPSKIIKQTKTILCPFITKIINISFKKKEFPDILKMQ